MSNYIYRPMDELAAREVSSWRYEPPYDIYNDVDLENSLECYLERTYHYYSVWQNQELIAFRCFGEDARVAGGNYSAVALDMGGGLRPDLTGKGMGASLMLSAFEFAKIHFNPKEFRCTVAGFNIRAQKVCLKVGYKEIQRFSHPKSDKEYIVFNRPVTV